jgi:hypothetical protein
MLTVFMELPVCDVLLIGVNICIQFGALDCGARCTLRFALGVCIPFIMTVFSSLHGQFISVGMLDPEFCTRSNHFSFCIQLCNLYWPCWPSLWNSLYVTYYLLEFICVFNLVHWTVLRVVLCVLLLDYVFHLSWPCLVPCMYCSYMSERWIQILALGVIIIVLLSSCVCFTVHVDRLYVTACAGTEFELIFYSRCSSRALFWCH